LFVCELETSCAYLISFFDKKNKYTYVASQDNYYGFLMEIAPWWGDLMENVKVVIRLPGADSYTLAAFFVIIVGFLGKLPGPKVSIIKSMIMYTKVIMTTRLIRILTFCAIVVPNPKPNCYAERFPPPANTMEFIRIMMTFRAGGCNDLIISGHTLFICVTCKFLFNYLGKASNYAVKVISFIVLTNIVISRNHYSIDVIFGTIIADLVWSKISKKYPEVIEEIHNHEQIPNTEPKKEETAFEVSIC